MLTFGGMGYAQEYHVERYCGNPYPPHRAGKSPYDFEPLAEKCSICRIRTEARRQVPSAARAGCRPKATGWPLGSVLADVEDDLADGLAVGDVAQGGCCLGELERGANVGQHLVRGE